MVQNSEVSTSLVCILTQAPGEAWWCSNFSIELGKNASIGSFFKKPPILYVSFVVLIWKILPTGLLSCQSIFLAAYGVRYLYIA